MFVEDHQAVQCLIKIRRWIQLQKLTSLLQEFRIIRNNVTGTHRRMSLGQIADTFTVDGHVQKLIQPFRKIKHLHQRICLIRQTGQFLLMCQGCTLDNFQNVLSCFIDSFHRNVTHCY